MRGGVSFFAFITRLGDSLSLPTRRRRSLRTVFLAGVLSAGMAGFTGVALAQDDPAESPVSETVSETSTTEPETTTPTTTPTTTSSEDFVPVGTSPEGSFVEIPSVMGPSVITASVCDGGAGSVEVTLTNPNDVELALVVALGDAQTREVTVAAGGTETVVFDDVAPGDHEVLVRMGEAVVGQSAASVDRCGEITEPVDDPLQVFVRCEDGAGLVTIRVFNLEGESRTYTLSVDDLELPGEIELGVDEYAIVVDEAEAPDGTFTVRVVAEGIDHSETAEVACAPAPSTPVTTTTTTTPVAQPRPAPAANSGDLASTGAAVGGIATLALLALGLGGGLVIMSRRRRTTPAGGSED